MQIRKISQQSPQVSIIIPIYNVAKYLKECLQSVVEQSYENLDIVLIDDGSDDESLNIALHFAEKDERIFVVSKPNGGQATARNFGLEFIKGSALRKSFESKLKDKENIQIQSFIKTHSFEKATKSLFSNELLAHFTQIQPHFIKSDLERINDFIVQELPQNALIHFVDSDDFIEPHCIELCVQNLLEKDLDIVVHNTKEFDDNTKKITPLKKLPQFHHLKYNDYNAGLELLTQNKIYDFYFAWQGLFKASILNRYALRYTEGIYHEDHDFGTLLFCLASKVAYIDEPLYIYRQRVNSTMSGQKNATMPSKLPSFLEPLRADFKDYKALRAYFKSYCFIVVGSKIWEFYTQKSAKDEAFKQKYQNFFRQIAIFYMKIFKSPLEPDAMGVKALLRKMNFPKCLIWREFFKDLHRQPKKIRYIKNIKYLIKG